MGGNAAWQGEKTAIPLRLCRSGSQKGAVTAQ